MKARLALTTPFVLVAVLLLVAVPAHAGPIVIDQSFTLGLSDHGYIFRSNQYAQTLTVGLTGFMTGIDLAIGRAGVGDLVVSILRTTTDGLPNDVAELAITTLPASYWPEPNAPNPEAYRHVAFSPFAVKFGDLLAINVRLASSESLSDVFYWYGTGGPDGEDYYTDGQAFSCSDCEDPLGHWTSMVSNHGRAIDFAFVSYVDLDTEAVPDPGSSLLLLGISLTGMGVWRQRRQ